MAGPEVAGYEARLSALRSAFLPAKFSPTGTYSPSDQEYFRAYRILAHAETESCLEQIVLKVANSSVAAWKKDGRTRRTVVSLLASHKFSNLIDYWDRTTSSRLGRPRLLNSNQAAVVTAVENALTSFRDRVRNNHGVSEEHLLKIAQPIGVKRHELDDLWLADLSSFGNERNGIAHSSGAATKLLDPQSEFATVERVRLGVRGFERVVLRLTRP